MSDPTIKIIVDAINRSDAGLREADRGLTDLRTRVDETGRSFEDLRPRVEQVDEATRKYLETTYNLGQGVDDVALGIAEQDNQFAAHRDRILENDQALQDLEVTNGELRDSITRVVEAERELSAAHSEALVMNENWVEGQGRMQESTENTYESIRQGSLELRRWMTTVGSVLVVGRLVQRGYEMLVDAADEAAKSGLVVADAYKEQTARGEENIDMGIRMLPVLTAIKKATNDLAEGASGLTDEERTLIEAEQAGLITFDQMNAAMYARGNRLQLVHDLVVQVTPALDEYKRQWEEAALAQERAEDSLSDLKTAMGMTKQLESFDENLAGLEQHLVDLRLQLENPVEGQLPEEFDALQTEYDETQVKIDETKEAHAEMIREMIFGIGEARIAAYMASEDYDSVIAQGMIDALYGVGDSWGLVGDRALTILNETSAGIDEFINSGGGFDLEAWLERVARDQDIQLRYHINMDDIPESARQYVEPYLKIPGRAAGGPVSAGMAYLVHKDEVIVPAQDGMVYNQAQQAAMGGNNDALLGSIDRKLDSLPSKLAAVLGTAIAKRSGY